MSYIYYRQKTGLVQGKNWFKAKKYKIKDTGKAAMETRFLKKL